MDNLPLPSLRLMHLVFMIMIASPAVAISDECARNISLACSASRYKSLCRKFISASPEAEDAARHPVQFVKVSIKVALVEVSRGLAALEDVNPELVGERSKLKELGFEDARELMLDSREVLGSCISEDLSSNSSLDNVRHWLSAALTYTSDSGEIVRDHPYLLKLFQRVIIPLLSNSLWIIDAFASSPVNQVEFRYWSSTNATFLSSRSFESRRRISRDLREWSRLLGEEISSRHLSEASAAAIVSQDTGYGTHSTIQAAINDAPQHLTRRYIIYIRAGVYDEIVRIPTDKTMLTLIGDGINQTIITGNLSTASNLTTFRTATMVVAGNGFMGRDLTVVNTAGPSTQAVAMRVDSDMSAFHRCSFWGFQDTLYTHAYRQFYRDCSIYGSVDFIFGNAASIFQNCNIQIRPGGPNRTTSTISAHGRTDPAQETAFVCQSCWITGTPEYMQVLAGDALAGDSRRHAAYLGRPWKQFARTVFIDSFLDVLIEPAGWLAWNGTDFIDTATLAEYRNYGPGYDPGSRVPWSQQLNPLSAFQFSVRGLIQGGFWLPFTGIPFRPLF